MINLSNSKQPHRQKNNTPVAKKYQQGITLIETIITLVILSFGVLALMKLQAFLIDQGTIAKQQSEATNFAQVKIEKLRDFESVTSGNNIKSYDDIASGAENIAGSATNYTLSWTVTNHTNPDHKVIDVSISWKDKNNNNHDMKLSSIISKFDPSTMATIIGASGAGGIQPN